MYIFRDVGFLGEIWEVLRFICSFWEKLYFFLLVYCEFILIDFGVREYFFVDRVFVWLVLDIRVFSRVGLFVVEFCIVQVFGVFVFSWVEVWTQQFLFIFEAKTQVVLLWGLYIQDGVGVFGLQNRSFFGICVIIGSWVGRFSSGYLAGQLLGVLFWLLQFYQELVFFVQVECWICGNVCFVLVGFEIDYF